jgi:hypothetical protein
MIIDRQASRLEAAGAISAQQGQAPEGVRFDLRRPGAKLAPGDFAILVGIEADRDIEIAQRDIPLTINRAVRAELNPQIAVGGEVRPRRTRSDNQREQQDEPAQHYRRPE